MDLTQLTFLRFIAALGVLLFHFHHGVPSLTWGEAIWSRANTAVSFFFFLSGFILTFVYAQRGLHNRSEFYLARLARIAPLYFVGLASIALVELSRGVLSFNSAALSAFMVQAWVPGYSQVINKPGWSLSVEWFFYLSFPFLLPRLSRLRSSAQLAWWMVGIWVASIASSAVFVRHLPDGGPENALVDFIGYHPLVHLPTFLVGMNSALLFVRHREAFTRWAVPLSCAALLSAAGTLLLLDQPLDRYTHNGLLAPVYLACIGALATMGDNWLVRALSRPSLVHLGEISYGMYILQGPTLVYFDYLLGAVGITLSPDAHFWTLCALIVAVAWVSHAQIEVPLRARIKTWTRPLLEPVDVPVTTTPT